MSEMHLRAIAIVLCAGFALGGAAEQAEIQTFLKQSQPEGPSFLEAQRELREVPTASLVEAMRAKESPESGQVALLVGFLAKRGDEESVRALTDFFVRPPVDADAVATREKAIDVVQARLLSLESIGIVGGPDAIPTLEKAATEQGAADLGKAWLSLLPDAYTGGSPHAIASIRGRAVRGLVYADAAGADQAATQFYEEARKNYNPGDAKSEHALNEAISALAQRDLIREIGLPERLKLYGSDEYVTAIAPYVEKYIEESKKPLH